jgi:hypothetical protein
MAPWNHKKNAKLQEVTSGESAHSNSANELLAPGASGQELNPSAQP